MGFPCFVNKGTVKIDTKPYGALTQIALLDAELFHELVKIDTKPYGALTHNEGFGKPF